MEARREAPRFHSKHLQPVDEAPSWAESTSPPMTVLL